MFKLKQLIEFITEDVLQEAKFDPKVLDQMPHSDRQDYLPDYIRQHFPELKEVDTGSSRTVFIIDSKRVLKVAKNIKGKAQNKAEVEIYTSNKDSGLFTKVFRWNASYTWILSELVRPLKQYKEFEELTGLDFFTLEKAFHIGEMPAMLEHYKSQYEGNNQVLQKWLSPNKPNYIDKYDIEGLQEKVQSLQKIYKSLTNPKVFDFLDKLLSVKEANELEEADLTSIGHWGKTADGRVVILDYGYTTNVRQTHYGNYDHQQSGTLKP